MKFNLHINQRQAIAMGIKNVQEALIFDFLSNRSFGEEVIINNTVWYFISRTKIVSELALLDLKSDTVYRYYKSLERTGLILYSKDKGKDLIRLTEKGKQYYSDAVDSTMSENNPSYYVGKKSENEKKIGKKSEKNSEKNPTYNTTTSKIIEEEEEEIYLQFAKWIPLKNKIQKLEVLANSLKNKIKNGDKRTIENFELFKKSLLKNKTETTTSTNKAKERLENLKSFYNSTSANELRIIEEKGEYLKIFDSMTISFLNRNNGLVSLKQRILGGDFEEHTLAELGGAA